jgi:hypothetical protein
MMRAKSQGDSLIGGLGLLGESGKLSGMIEGYGAKKQSKWNSVDDDDHHETEIRAANKNLRSMGLAAGGKLSK